MFSAFGGFGNVVGIKVTADTKDAEAKLKGLTTFLKTGFAAVAAKAITDVALAMDQLNVRAETVGRKVEVVFGSMAQSARDWAATQKEAFGVGQTEMEAMLASVQDILIPMGFARDEAFELAKGLLETANASSEFEASGMTAQDAVLRFTKALTGERESLKELGIVISELDVKQRLAEKGQAGLTGEALKQAKAQATAELITESSADALSVYEQRTGSAVAAQKEMASQTEDLAFALSELWRPALESAKQEMGGMISEVKSLIDWMVELDDSRPDWLDFGLTPTSLGSSRVEEAIRQQVELTEATRQAAVARDEDRHAAAGQGDAVRDVTSETAHLSRGMDVARHSAAGMGDELRTTRDILANELSQALTDAKDQVVSDVDAFVDGFQELPEQADITMAQFTENLTNRTTLITNFFNNLRFLASQGFTDLVDELATAGPEVGAQLASDFAQDKTAAAEANAAAAGERIANEAGSNLVDTLFGKNLPDEFRDVGFDAMAGLAGGVNAGTPMVTSAVRRALNQALAAAQAAIESGSPSKVWEREVGIPIPQGIAAGVESAAAEAKKSVEDMLDEMLGDAVGGAQKISSALNAQFRLDEAQARLGELRGRSGTIGGDIAGATRALSQARAAARGVTPEEQVRIEQAQANLNRLRGKDEAQAVKDAEMELARARSGFSAGTHSAQDIRRAEDELVRAREKARDSKASPAEIALAEQRLKEARADSKGPTRDVENAERRLAELREEQKDLPRELRSAELGLVDAHARLVRAQSDLNKLAPGSWQFFNGLISRAGVSSSYVWGLIGDLRSLSREVQSMPKAVVVSGGGGGGGGGGSSPRPPARPSIPPGPPGPSGRTVPRGRNVPMAEGGIVKARPGGTDVTVGEAGEDEAIVPLNGGLMGGWPERIVIELDGKVVAEVARKEIIKTQKRNGSSGIR